jgi:hypothetical protein
MLSGTLFGLLGVGIARIWFDDLWVLLGVLPLVLIAFPAGKIVDSRWGRLRITGVAEPAATAVCEECKSELNVQDMITHNGRWYCGRCKPVFLQKLAEGSAPAPRAPHKHVLRRWWFWLWIFLVILATWFFVSTYVFPR